ncbi:hypothetical protein HZA96_00515, partial [Candidatus Woesearchaeota archaeon]|nr:hypothetical protein [Candidatus Woesearchaeota archaeon]
MNLTQQLKTWYQSHFSKDSKDYQARIIAKAIDSEPFSPSFSTILYAAGLVPLALVG